jgi:single-strand DNA-binding protein
MKWKESAMFETPITVVGNIVTNPVRHRVGDQEVMRFRVASNSRRRTAEGAWEPGNSLFVGVSCWGKLVTGVGASLGKGDAVIVVGHVYTSEYEDREGVRRSSVEVRATSVGPDLARCIARIENLRHPGSSSDEAAASTTADDADDTADAQDHDPDGDGDPADGEAAVDANALALSA